MVDKENADSINVDYRPFNIAEMEVKVEGSHGDGAKQDELIKMYQQMGLLM